MFQPTEEVLNVLKPLDPSNYGEASGKPLSLGILPSLFNVAAWPEIGLQENVKFHRALETDLVRAIKKKIPASFIKSMMIDFEDTVLKPGQGRLKAYPHLDSEGFTAFAAFPQVIHYPDVVPADEPELMEENLWTMFEPGQKLDFVQKLKPYAYRPAFGEAVLWNDMRYIHGAPINDKTREEWLEDVKDWSGADRWIQQDGSVRSVFIRAIMTFHDNKVVQSLERAGYYDQAFAPV